MKEEHLTEQIIGAAIEVHKHWGPGLYEEIYLVTPFSVTSSERAVTGMTCAAHDIPVTLLWSSPNSVPPPSPW